MFVKGWLTGEVKPNGRIVASFENMVQIDAPRPRMPAEVSSLVGSIPEELEKINQRVPGTTFETSARLGAGVAVMTDIRFLKWADESTIMNKVEDMVGSFGPTALLGHFRNILAPGTYSCMDICAGVATLSSGIEINAFKEAVELGVYRSDGWAHFQLPSSHREFRRIMEDEQTKEWLRLNPNLKARYDVPVHIVDSIEMDRINEISAILSSEMNNGSIEVIVPALMNLSQKEDWLLCDTEHRFDGSRWVPLNRRPQVVCSRFERPPVKFTFGPTGLDPDADIIFLEGRNLRSINQKVASVLQALKWL